MRSRSNFSGGRRGPVIKPEANKVRITIRLDSDVIEHFKRKVREAGGGNYQTAASAPAGGNAAKSDSPGAEAVVTSSGIRIISARAMTARERRAYEA